MCEGTSTRLVFDAVHTKVMNPVKVETRYHSVVGYSLFYYILLLVVHSCIMVHSHNQSDTENYEGWLSPGGHIAQVVEHRKLSQRPQFNPRPLPLFHGY